MTMLYASLSGLAEHWLAAIGRASLYGGAVLALVWVVCHFFPRLPARYRCWLWRLAFLKLLLCLFFVNTLSLPVLPSFLHTASPVEEQLQGEDQEENAADSIASSDSAFSGPLFSDSVFSESQDQSPAADSTVDLTVDSTASTPVIGWTDRILPLIFFGIWAAIVVGLAGLMVMRIVMARRWRRRCVLIKDRPLLTLGEQLSQQLGLVQPPLLFEADFCHSPVVFGAVRTAIVLPRSLVEKMTLGEMRLILAHEMSHIRRGDLLSNWFVSIVSGFFFFHPLVWLAFRETRLAQETACDEFALNQTDGSVVEYGNLIVDLATHGCRTTSPIVAVGVVESFQKSLKRRISAMKNFGTGSLPVVVLSWLFVGIVAVALLPWSVVAKTLGKAEKEVARQNIHVSDTSGKYTITVDGVRRGSGHTMHSWTGLPMVPESSSVNNWSKDTGNGSVSAATSTSGGGFGMCYKQPNLVLDVLVDGSRKLKGNYLLCELNGSVKAEDDLGNTLESPNMPAYRRMRFENLTYPEGSGRTAIHLYQPKASNKASYIKSLDGELIVVDAKRSEVTFQAKDLSRPSSKSDNGISMKLVSFSKTPDGIDVTVSVPQPPLKNEHDMMERMQSFMKSQHRLSVTLEDTDGRIYQPVGVGSTSGGSGSGSMGGGGMGGPIMMNGNGMGNTMMRSGTMTGGTMMGGGNGGNGNGSGITTRKTTRQFPGGKEEFTETRGTFESSSDTGCHFAPLPEGAKLKAVHCTVTDLLGEPQKVPFHLEEIPLFGVAK